MNIMCKGMHVQQTHSLLEHYDIAFIEGTLRVFFWSPFQTATKEAPYGNSYHGVSFLEVGTLCLWF